MKNIWKILEIEETKNENLIKEAYRKKLVQVNPEDDPEGFKALRTAYEEATKQAKSKESTETNDENLTEVDVWMKNIEGIYTNFFKRIEVSNWEQAFQDNICVSLDTVSEVRERLLAYLMDNFRLPEQVWKCIEEHFHILEDKTEFYERFPKDFIDFVERSILNEEFPSYTLFAGDGDEDFDGFISSYFQLKNCLDDGTIENFESLYTACKDYFVYHPYLLVEEARYYIKQQDLEKAEENLIRAYENHSEDNYILYYLCDTYLKEGKTELAYEHFKTLLERVPQHYSAQLGIAECHIHNEEYEKARDIYYDILEDYHGDNYTNEKLMEINQFLIEKYQKEFEQDKNNIKPALELGWCLCRDEKYQEVVDLLDGLIVDDKNELEYNNLKGRSLFYNKEYEQAIDYLAKWLDGMEAIEPDDTIATHKKIRRIGYAYFILGCSYAEVELREKEPDLKTAFEYIHNAIQKEKDDYGRLSYKNQEAFLLFRVENYEKCVDICDEIIKESEYYYPAYVKRQEAYYKLKRYQDVIDDYYRAIEVYSKDQKPYELAIKTFLEFDKYEDAKNILDRAKQEEVTSDQLLFYEAKLLRMMSKSNEEIQQAYELLFVLKEKTPELEKIGDAWHESSLCKLDLGELDVSLEEINKAIQLLPNDEDYLYTNANILFEQREYEKAKEIYEGLIEIYPNSDTLLIKMGRIYDMLSDVNTALSYFSKVLELYPDHSSVHYYLGVDYENLGDEKIDSSYYEKALVHYSKIIEINPNDYNYNDRGLLYTKMSRFDEAIEDYKKAIESNKENPYPYNNMGVAYKYKKEYEEAISCFLKAIELMNGARDINSFIYAASCYSSLQKFDLAEKYYQENINVYSEDETNYCELAEFYRRRKEFDKAIHVYNEAKEKLEYLEEYDYYKWLADTYAENEDDRKAEYFYKKALKTNPDSSDMYSSYGEYCFFGKLNYKKALRYYEKANKLLDENTQYSYYENLYTMGKIYYYLGEKEKAKQAMKKAMDYYIHTYGSISQYISNVEYRAVRIYRIAILYYYMGDTQKAAELFEQMKESVMCKYCKFSKCYEAMIGEGLLLESNGNTQEALKIYKEASQLESDMFVYFLINRLTKKQKRWF